MKGSERSVKIKLIFLFLLAGLTLFSCRSGNSGPGFISPWIWVSGNNSVNPPGVYGVLGQTVGGNVPGGRRNPVSWIDKSGNLWLFGGAGYDSAGHLGDLNDLWKFDGTNWTWLSGSSTVNRTGVYGVLGQAAGGNIPGARVYAVSWIDVSGNKWLFGGVGYDSAGNVGDLDDLWKFDGTNWTWLSGSSTVNRTESMACSARPPAGISPERGFTP